MPDEREQLEEQVEGQEPDQDGPPGDDYVGDPSGFFRDVGAAFEDQVEELEDSEEGLTLRLRQEEGEEQEEEEEEEEEQEAPAAGESELAAAVKALQSAVESIDSRYKGVQGALTKLFQSNAELRGELRGRRGDESPDGDAEGGEEQEPGAGEAPRDPRLDTLIQVLEPYLPELVARSEMSATYTKLKEQDPAVADDFRKTLQSEEFVEFYESLPTGQDYLTAYKTFAFMRGKGLTRPPARPAPADTRAQDGAETAGEDGARERTPPTKRQGPAARRPRVTKEDVAQLRTEQSAGAPGFSHRREAPKTVRDAINRTIENFTTGEGPEDEPEEPVRWV